MNEGMYQENILEHNRHPHNKKKLEVFDIEEDAQNPSCGDSLTLFLKLEDNAVADVGFRGDGCAISQAAASMLTDRIKGLSVAELKLLSPGDIYTMLGITISPGRVNCALLAYQALSQGLKKI